MAKRRLNRNTPVGSTSNDKKLQPEDPTKISTRTRGSANRKDASESDAQGQEASSNEEANSEGNSPVRSTRLTRRSQINPTTEGKDTKITEVVNKTVKAVETTVEVGKQSASPRSKLRSTSPRGRNQQGNSNVKKQSISPSVRSTRTKLRSDAEAVIDKANSNNDDALKSNKTLQQVKQQTSSPKLTRLTRKTTDALVKKEESTDDDAAELKECLPDIKLVASKRSVRIQKTDNSNNIAVAEEEKLQHKVVEVKESMPGLNEQTSTVKTPPHTCTVKADTSHEVYSKSPIGDQKIVADKLNCDEQTSSSPEKLQKQPCSPDNKLPESLPMEIGEVGNSQEDSIFTGAEVLSKKGQIMMTSPKAEKKIETVDDASRSIDMKEVKEEPLDMDISHEKSSGISKVPLNVQEHKEINDDEMKINSNTGRERVDEEINESSGIKTEKSEELELSILEPTIHYKKQGVTVKESVKIPQANETASKAVDNMEKVSVSVEENQKGESISESYPCDDPEFLLVDEEELDYEYQDDENHLESGNQNECSKVSLQIIPEISDTNNVIEKNQEVEKKEADKACAMKIVDEESNEKGSSALELGKTTEELDYEVSEAEEDSVSLAPDELVIMEEDPEYMSLIAEVVDEKEDKKVDQKGKQSEKQAKTSSSDSRKNRHSKERKDDRSSRAKDRSRKDTNDRKTYDREKRERSRDREQRHHSSGKEKGERSHTKERRERSREREKRESQRSSLEKTKKNETSADCSGYEKEGYTSKDTRIFDSIYILANRFYKPQMKQFEAMPMVHVQYNDKLSSETLRKTIKNCKKIGSSLKCRKKRKMKRGASALYIIVSGLYTVIDYKKSKDCDKCRNQLTRILMPSQPAPVDNIVNTVNVLCDDVQKELGSSDAIIMIPPLPAVVADMDVNLPHEKIHNAAKGSKLCGDRHTIKSVDNYYRKFCKVWIDVACNRIKPWGDVKPFQRYGSTLNTCVFESPSYGSDYEVNMKKWQGAMSDFLHIALNSSTSKKENKRESKPEVILIENKRESKPEVILIEDEDERTSEEKFDEVAIIGSTDFTSRLQELTKGLKVVHINENIDLDDDGIASIKKLQEQHKAKTLWIILSGISEVAEPVEQGPPKCKLLKCKEPLPAYVTRNDKLGAKECKNMSVTEMVESVVKVAFDFAMQCSEALKDGSALFLAPIMPLRAIWAGHATPHSHDSLHKMHSCNSNVPLFMGSSNTWVDSTVALERVWLAKIMENVSEKSEPYKLMKKYDEEKPSVFGYVEDVSLPEVTEIQEKWAILMSDIIKFYLHGICTSETKQALAELPQTLVPPSDHPQESLPPQPNLYPQDAGVIPGLNPLIPMVQAPVTIGPPVFQAQQSVFTPDVPGPIPSQGWFPASSVFGPPLTLPVIGTAPQVLPAPSVIPVTGCTIEAEPKLKTPMKGHLIVQGMNTIVDKSLVRTLCQAFGEVEEIKWPQTDNLVKNFLMIHFLHRSPAEQAERILNYLKPFGENSVVKLIGSKQKGGTKLESDDMELLLSIHPIVDQIKRSARTHTSPTAVAENTPTIPKLLEIQVAEAQNEAVHTIIVKNFPNIVPLQDINDMFVDLGATSKGILISNALHFTFKGDISVLKALSGFRFYDRNIDIEIKGPFKDKQCTAGDKRKAKAKYKEPVSKLMDGIAKLLQENIEEEFNIYTFKTRGCRYGDGCKEKDLCNRFHNASDRRRCLIMFRYSDEMCPSMESSGSCEKKDKCSYAHSAVEVLFHYNNFRMNVCPGAKSRKICDKVGRVCSYLHPEMPEMLYNEKWENLYVEGLHKSLVYLTEAIKNLYLLKDLQCVRVLLLTPTNELAHFYLKCTSDLAKACNQKVDTLSNDGSFEAGTSVVISSTDSFRNNVNANCKKKMDLNRLKALIIDDCPSVLQHVSKNGLNKLEELAKEGVNLVLTAKKVTGKEVIELKSKIHPRGGITKIINDSDVKRKPSNKSSSSGSYKNDLLERDATKKKENEAARKKVELDIKTSEPSSKSKADQKSSSRDRDSSSKSSRDRDSNSKASRDRDSNSKAARDRDSNSKASRDRNSNSKASKDRDSNSKASKDRDSNSKASKDRDSNSKASKDRDSNSKSKIEDERCKILSDLKNDYENAKRELKREHDRELELYLQSPEVHPEYETKYSIFMEQYKIQYPDRNDIEHSNKLWEAFWKEVVMFILQEEYDSRSEALEKEYQSRKDKELKRLQDKEQITSKEELSKAQKRSSSSRQEPSSKYSRSESSQDVSSKRSEKHRDKNGKDADSSPKARRNQGLTDHLAPESRGNPPIKIPDDALGGFSLEDAINSLNEISHLLGVLGPAAQLLCKNIENTWSDLDGLRRLFDDEDNKLVMRRIADKARELSEAVEFGTKSLKYRMASLYATKVLNFVLTSQPPPSSQLPVSLSSSDDEDDDKFGLDIDHISRVTYNKDPTSIIQSIKSALLSKGIVNASEEQITKIYVTVTSAHFNMACNKPKDTETEKAQVHTQHKAPKREAPESDHYGNVSKYRRQEKQDTDSWENAGLDSRQSSHPGPHGSQGKQQMDSWQNSGLGSLQSSNYDPHRLQEKQYMDSWQNAGLNSRPDPHRLQQKEHMDPWQNAGLDSRQSLRPDLEGRFPQNSRFDSIQASSLYFQQNSKLNNRRKSHTDTLLSSCPNPWQSSTTNLRQSSHSNFQQDTQYSDPLKDRKPRSFSQDYDHRRSSDDPWNSSAGTGMTINYDHGHKGLDNISTSSNMSKIDISQNSNFMGSSYSRDYSHGQNLPSNGRNNTMSNRDAKPSISSGGLSMLEFLSRYK